MDVSNIFSARGRAREIPRRQEGGWVGFRVSQERGWGRGAGRVSAGNLEGVAKLFFSGAEIPTKLIG